MNTYPVLAEFRAGTSQAWCYAYFTDCDGDATTIDVSRRVDRFVERVRCATGLNASGHDLVESHRGSLVYTQVGCF